MPILQFFRRLFDANQRAIARMQKTVERINALEPQYQAMDAAQLHNQTAAFRARLEQGETLDDLLPEAFAAVREAAQRTTGMRHYDVQLIGGMILHEGKVAEMRTGEGKTLVATLPLYLNALLGRGAHLVTPNDYLAKIGAQWMGGIYHTLGMSISVIQSGAGNPDEASFRYDPEYTSEDDRYQHLRNITRRQAYESDITYGTNNEFGFDYLRDNMVLDVEQCAQRDLYYAIVDEVDSILIDEARTPLIISGPAEESSEMYRKFALLVPRLHREKDYTIDERTQVVMLTDDGIARLEHELGIPEGASLYDPEHAGMLPYLDNALRAREFFQRDKQYVVREGEIIIVDEFTGRMMFGRRYSEGLHQAIEAKENVRVRHESLTYATITFQNFFRMYDKLAGMTGTATTEKEELRKIYDLDVLVLPTHVEYRARFNNLKEKTLRAEESSVAFAGVLNQEMNYKVTVFDGTERERYYRRLDLPDQIYKTEEAKFNAVIGEIKAAHEAGRPVLVGTTAIETSERLAQRLERARIRHEVLNAKQHEKEAIIIAQAGRPGSVTIATNMAGRGVDILLGGNAEGLARDQLRHDGEDLMLIRSADWDDALKMARRGEDPTTRYPGRWAEVLLAKVRECEADRQKVYALGGLHVIGTERHEARRIDNQLRGRAGRQGDPGSSRFYISLEDELMHRFGGERLQPWMDRAGLEEAPLEFDVLSRLIASIQERVEGYNFDIRKHVLEYDNVVNKQRGVVYAERRKVLERDDLRADMLEIVRGEVLRALDAHLKAHKDDDEEDEATDYEGLLATLRLFIPMPRDFNAQALSNLAEAEIEAQCMQWAEMAYEQLNRQYSAGVYQHVLREGLSLQQMAASRDLYLKTVGNAIQNALGEEATASWYELPLQQAPNEYTARIQQTVLDTARLLRDRWLMLRELDEHWRRHLTALDMLREGIGLRAYGQQDPLVAYQRESATMYQEMMQDVEQQVARALFKVPQEAAPRSAPRNAGQPGVRPVPQRAPAAPVTRTNAPAARSQPVRVSSRQQLGRNDPCWCGSGKKYKDCHWRQDKRQPAQS